MSKNNIKIPKLGTPADLEKLSEILPAPTPAAESPWKREMVMTGRGQRKPILANVALVLRSDPSWVGVIGFDALSETPVLLKAPPYWQGSFHGPAAITDQDLRATAAWIQTFGGITANVGVTTEAVLLVAAESKFHPLQTYLNGLHWDGRNRIDQWPTKYLGAADTAFVRAVGRRWLIQAVARAYRPGCQADAMLILEGPQGVGKSTALRTLADPWFTDHLPDLANKDALLQMRGMWIIELAEMASLSKTETARIKAFITTRDDRYRSPFGRIAETHPRSCVFSGTINPGAGGYLRDETGARRFWPLLTGKIDLAALKADRDQLWAEARQALRGGEAWHITEPHLVAAAIIEQSERFDSDPWHETVEQFIDGKDRVTLDELLRDLGKNDKGGWEQRDQNRLARILTKLGWKRVRRRREYGGKSDWFYTPPSSQ